MPTLIIQTNEDGTVSIAAPAQVPPELMADAEQVESLEQAAQIVQDVLGAEQTGSQGEQMPAEPGQGQEGQMQQPPEGDQEAAMEQGYRNVRGAPR